MNKNILLNTIAFLSIFNSLALLLPFQGFAQNCDCNDQIYLNDPDTDEIHKFEVDPVTGALTEIGFPWSSGITPPVNAPHGLGIDLNGNVFIGELNAGIDGPDGVTDVSPQGNIYKITCDGTLIDEFYKPATFAGAFNFGSAYGLLYIPDNQNETIRIFDPNCAGDLIGEIQIGGGTDVLIWGFYVDEDGWYASDASTGNIYTGSSDPALFTLPATNTGTLFASTGFVPVSNPPFGYPGIVGTTKDAAGNVYVLLNAIGVSGPTHELLKYDPSGTLITSISTVDATGPNLTNGLPGWGGSRGMIYSETSNFLYVSGLENCLTVFDTNLVEQTALNIGNPAGTRPKGTSVTTECCPNPAVQDISQTYCSDAFGEQIFLNAIFNCDGTICEGTSWESADAASAAIYETCSQTITNTPGCYSFTKVSDGTGTNARCGAFNITFNICLENAPTPPAISVTNNTCSPDVAGSINIDTPCSADSAIEWSTDAGATWSANQPTYTNSPITIRARCANSCGNAETADVATIPEECCPPVNCVRQFGDFTFTKRLP